MYRKYKTAIHTCDRCLKTATLVVYHPRFGWYCKDCLEKIEKGLSEVVQAIDDAAAHINAVLVSELGDDLPQDSPLIEPAVVEEVVDEQSV